VSIPAWAAPALFSVLASAAAYCDVRYRTIPNWLNLAIAVLGIAATWLVAGIDAVPFSLAHFALALVIGMVAFALKMWGGGDAKFYAATAAWFSLRQFPSLIIAVSLAGLVLLVAWLVSSRVRRRESSSGRKAQLPYGLAIAVGGIVTMVLSPLS
jgi:prepilin peptidase CpaA